MSHHPYLVLAVGGVVIALVFGLQIRRAHQRRQALIEMGARLGFQSLEDSPPPANVFFKGTDFWGWTRMVNRFAGSVNGIEASVFDFEKDNYRNTWKRTVISLRTQDAPSARDLGLITQRIGDWQWYYKTVGTLPGEKLMSAEEIERNLRLLAAEATSSRVPH
jgi:hypothetical protein